MEYLRVRDGGLKDEYLLDYNFLVRLVGNYECGDECGGDTQQEGHYRVFKEFRAEKGERVVRCSHEYIALGHWLLAFAWGNG